jgi:phosphoadenosine phosphosulfate reductase
MSTARTLSGLPNIDAGTHPEEIFRIGRDISGGQLTMACSFSIEDVALLDLLRDHFAEFTVFAIDTGRLNEETYEIAESIAIRYGIRIDWYFPRQEAVEKIERDKGLFSFRNTLEDRKQCCHVRKLEPLQRAIKGTSGWITGMRREQSVTRSDQQPLEIDHVNGGLLKINPLTYWTENELWDYTKKKRLPVNALYHQGYTSIGCAPCTRATRPGEDVRAGRWWWEDPEHRECGLHRR